MAKRYKNFKQNLKRLVETYGEDAYDELDELVTEEERQPQKDKDEPNEFQE